MFNISRLVCLLHIHNKILAKVFISLFLLWHNHSLRENRSCCHWDTHFAYSSRKEWEHCHIKILRSASFVREPSACQMTPHTSQGWLWPIRSFCTRHLVKALASFRPRVLLFVRNLHRQGWGGAHVLLRDLQRVLGWRRQRKRGMTDRRVDGRLHNGGAGVRPASSERHPAQTASGAKSWVRVPADARASCHEALTHPRDATDHFRPARILRPPRSIHPSTRTWCESACFRRVSMPTWHSSFYWRAFQKS